MKKQFFSFLVIAVVLITSCTPLVRSAASLEDAASINIECRDEINLKQLILQQLRVAQAKDLTIDSDGAFLRIKASFRLRETPLYKIDNMKRDMQETPGVLFATVEVNKTVVKQSY